VLVIIAGMIGNSKTLASIMYRIY